MNVWDCNNPVKCGCRGRIFEEKRLDLLLVTEMKMKEGVFLFGKMNWKICGLGFLGARDKKDILMSES